ncbi:MAG TPA: Uma2 family endonuclease [Polyangiaceae bacterium]|nr:Uma2 family endonuclease [Polyangiaceae bacterium]
MAWSWASHHSRPRPRPTPKYRPAPSPLHTAALDRVEKLPICAREGVPHVCLIEPRLQTLEAFTLDSSRYQLRSAQTARVAPFEALELELSALWAR